MFDLLAPIERLNKKDERAGYDRHCYIRGKEDAEQELPRSGDVYYSNQRDIDCYNMGYTYGQS